MFFDIHRSSETIQYNNCKYPINKTYLILINDIAAKYASRAYITMDRIIEKRKYSTKHNLKRKLTTNQLQHYHYFKINL